MALVKLARAGIRIGDHRSAADFSIHGTVVEADYGTASAKIFIGSENFSKSSTFAADFRNGRHWSSK